MKKKYEMSESGAGLTPCEFKKGVFVNSMACVGCDCYRGVDETIETLYCSQSSETNLLPPLKIWKEKTFYSFEQESNNSISLNTDSFGKNVYVCKDIVTIAINVIEHQENAPQGCQKITERLFFNDSCFSCNQT